jgi:hypothetical protein
MMKNIQAEWGSLINLERPKLHKLHHLVDSIRLLGHPKWFNGDIYECNHLVMKDMYRCVVMW